MRLSSFSKLLTWILLVGTDGAYLPGVNPHNYVKGEPLSMEVNAMTSVHTQIPKDYYHLPFCQPTDGVRMQYQNLGQFLTGNKIQSSAYDVNMLKETFCQTACQTTLGKTDAHKLRMHIKDGYHNNWILDNLPSAAIGVNKASGERQERFTGGFPIGFIDTATEISYIYNHVNIFVHYRSTADGDSIVHFAVEPMSIAHEFQLGYEWDGYSPEGYANPLFTCDYEKHMERTQIKKNQVVEPGGRIIYTYDVVWKESDVAWSSRWDIYLSEDRLVPAQVHWRFINFVLVVLLGLSVALCCLFHELHSEIATNQAYVVLPDREVPAEACEPSWKLIQQDVFRPPENFHMLICVFTGNGVQLGLTMLLTIFLSAMGFVNPSRRGLIVTCVLICFSVTGIIAGYVSSRLYKATNGDKWTLCAVATAMLVPGIAFCMFLYFNILLFCLKSTASAPMSVVIILASLWHFVYAPLVALGAFVGYRQDVRTFSGDEISESRRIPTPPIWQRPLLGILAAGILPFVTIYIELYFIMLNLWTGLYYYAFGFALIVFLLLVVVCSQVTILLVYCQLSAGNHRWWWFAFLAPGSMGLYTFLYSILWFHQMEAAPLLTTYLLYFGYMALISFGMTLVTGAVGTLSSLWFLQRLYLLDHRCEGRTECRHSPSVWKSTWA
jgi:transmembrane 9 superfamily protein 2/4